MKAGEGWATPDQAPDGFWFDMRYWGYCTWDFIQTPIGERPRVLRADEHVLLPRALVTSILQDRPQGFLIDRRADATYFVIDGTNQKVSYQMGLPHRLVDCLEAHRIG